MQNNKLIVMLNQLNRDDLERLEAFLLLNKLKIRKQCQQLFAIVFEALKSDKKEELLDKKVVCKKLFGSDSKISSINTLCINGIVHIKDFFAYIEYENDENLKSYLFQKSINKNELFELFVHQYPKDFKKLNDRKVESIGYYQANFNFQLELLNFATKRPSIDLTKKLKKKLDLDKTDEITSLSGIIDSFKLYSLVNKIRIACLIANRSSSVRKTAEYDFNDVNSIKSKVNEQILKENPLIDLYYNTLLTLTGEHLKYKKVLSIIDLNKDKNFGSEISEILVFLTNYFSNQIKDGKVALSKIRFKIYFILYKHQVNQKLEISVPILKNLITLALKEKEFDLAQEIFDDNIKIIPKNERYSFKIYCTGLLAFHKSDFAETVSIIFPKWSKMNESYKIACRLLLFKSYFELNRDRSFNSERDNFKKFVNNKRKYTKKTKHEYINFINILNRVYNLKNMPNLEHKKLNAVRRDFAKKPIYDKFWLKEKIDELDKGNKGNKNNKLVR